MGGPKESGIYILQFKSSAYIGNTPALYSKMALNPNYESIGKAFVQQYYALFDDKNSRPNLVNLYNADQSLMSFEGVQVQGSAKIMEKISSLSFDRIAHSITSIDCQPMFDGGILINVLGQLKVS